MLLVFSAFICMSKLRESFPAPTFQTPLFFCSIVLSGWMGGFGPGILATLASMFFIKFFFSETPHSFAFSMSELPRYTVFFIVGGFVSWLNFRQRRDENALMQIREELEEKVRERTTALADERSRMAAEVHDTLAQAFAATLLHLRSMKSDSLEPEMRPHWIFAQETAAAGLAAARRAMNAVRPAVPSDGRPLADRLEEKVRQAAARSSAQVRFQAHGEMIRLPWTVEDEIERLACEALFNAERHAAASEISVKLDFLAGSGLRLRVRDNGRGFDQDSITGSGFGLQSMHERAERIGATFTLITEEGQGTEMVAVWMPGEICIQSEIENEPNRS